MAIKSSTFRYQSSVSKKIHATEKLIIGPFMPYLIYRKSLKIYFYNHIAPYFKKKKNSKYQTGFSRGFNPQTCLPMMIESL